jgi:hypothetical protein
VTSGVTHLDQTTTPGALAILEALLAGHDRPPSGYETTAEGAWLDWDLLLESVVLSSSEIAALHIARGCGLAERIGGLPRHSARPVLNAIERITANR